MAILNFDDNTASNDLLKRLNEIQMKQEKRKLQDQEISSKEQQHIDEFHQRELASASVPHCKYIYQQFFKEIENPRLRHYFEEVAAKRGKDKAFLQLIVKTVCKTNREQPKLSFLFKIFSNYQ